MADELEIDETYLESIRPSVDEVDASEPRRAKKKKALLLLAGGAALAALVVGLGASYGAKSRSTNAAASSATGEHVTLELCLEKESHWGGSKSGKGASSMSMEASSKSRKSSNDFMDIVHYTNDEAYDPFLGLGDRKLEAKKRLGRKRASLRLDGGASRRRGERKLELYETCEDLLADWWGSSMSISAKSSKSGCSKSGKSTRYSNDYPVDTDTPTGSPTEELSMSMGGSKSRKSGKSSDCETQAPTLSVSPTTTPPTQSPTGPPTTNPTETSPTNSPTECPTQKPTECPNSIEPRRRTQIIIGQDCSCAPLKYNFELDLTQSCEDDTLEGSPGIGLTFCFLGISGAQEFAEDLQIDNLDLLGTSLIEVQEGEDNWPGQEEFLVAAGIAAPTPGSDARRSRNLQGASDVEIFSVQFLEFDTTGELIVINQDDSYANVSLATGDVVTFESISSNLDPCVPIEEQLDFFPGGVQVTMRGLVTVDGEELIVSNRVTWSYSNACDAEPIGAGDEIGWLTVPASPALCPASQAFCPVAPA